MAEEEEEWDGVEERLVKAFTPEERDILREFVRRQKFWKEFRERLARNGRMWGGVAAVITAIVIGWGSIKSSLAGIGLWMVNLGQ